MHLAHSLGQTPRLQK